MKKILLVALATLALIGCNNKQSQLDFNDIVGRAVVQGYVYVDRGYQQDGNAYVLINEPAEGCAVAVKVPYKKYDANATDGDKIFETVCDANGFYSVEIPVGQAAITGATVHTRPFTGKYYDMVNGNVIEIEASFAESQTSVDIENGKTFTAANMIVTKDVTAPNFSRQQVITLSGQIAQMYEKRTWIDSEDHDKGYTVSADKQNANQAVKLKVEFSNNNPRYASQKLIYDITTDETGNYTLSANLYDVWDINDVAVSVTAQSYLSSTTHYYKKFNKDDKKFEDKTQTVEGYYNGYTINDLLSEGDKLIGHTMPAMSLNFVPNYATQTIYGIGNTSIDIVNGETIYLSDNVLGWHY